IALDGSLRGIPGVLPLALAGNREDFQQMFTAPENYLEVEPTGLQAISVPHLRSAVAILEGRLTPEPPAEDFKKEIPEFDPRDFADVKGQPSAKKALCTAAAGGHNALMIGPPGTGKSMLASRLPGILPPLTKKQALQTTCVHSVAGELLKRGQLIDTPPFRSPHHTISGAGLIGGGQNPRPGEASLAHHGVLFLDEMPEFQRNILETLRQPMETGEIHISRARSSCHFPANFLLLGAMNPCPCGYLSHPERQCICTPSQIDRYRRKLSGPLLDRIDLHLSVGPISYDELTGGEAVEDTADMRSRVQAARNRQESRYEEENFFLNAELPAPKIDEYCPLEPGAESLLKQAVDSWGYSARTVHRLQKVGRTLADIQQTENITENQMAEALQYREFELDGWQQ
ncbi:MAG: YifB family Mg chelatase-like AAA ATPase, partial [bacterium]